MPPASGKKKVSERESGTDKSNEGEEAEIIKDEADMNREIS